MAARNVNLFAVPYGDAADVVAEQVDGDTATVSLRTAAQTLSVLEVAGGEAPAERSLRRSLSESLADVHGRYRSRIAPTVGAGTARRAVEAASGRWDTVSERALAVTDGRMAEAIVDELAVETTDRQRDRLAVELRVASKTLRADRSFQVDESLVESAVDLAPAESDQIAKAGMHTVGTAAGKAAWRRATGAEAGGLPAGLPLLPVPGSWYATVNAWTVSVRGSYDVFTVRANRASPGRTENGTIEYVRREESVSIDVDGDGTGEALGRNRPITFAAETGVVVVVPPGGSGVGDVDGNADERSPGWGR